MNNFSQIIITDDFESVKEELKSSIEPAFLNIFEADEFKIDMAKELIKEAMLATHQNKYIVTFASKYNLYAQNALLKIVEEPPKNIVFIFVAKTKSTFLPTILSRLPVKKIKSKYHQKPVEFKNFDLETLYGLIQKKMDKSEAKAIVKAMLLFCAKSDFKLTPKELESFKYSFELIELNSSPSTILTNLGLIILKHQKRKR